MRVRFAGLALSILLISLMGRTAAPARAADVAALEQLQDTMARVADEVRPSVVAIRAERKADDEEFDRDMPDDEIHRPFRERSSNPDKDAEQKPPKRRRLWPAVGSGVIISGEGHVLTNEHVIHNAEPQDIECVLWDGRSVPVEGLTSDPRSDLAVLKLPASGLHAARLGDAAKVRQGHFAIVMGNPFGSAIENYGRSTMSFGIVSALGQDLTQKLDLSQQRYYGNLIQTDARINPGNSGGPLLNIRGEVIGITTAISTRSGTSEGVGYAISIDDRVRQIVEHLRRGENVEYGFLGVQLDRPTDSQRRLAGGPASGGALVREVTPGAPAAGKLQSGDIVAEFNHAAIDDVDQLIRLVGAAPVGREVQVKLYRGGQAVSLGVTPARKTVLRGVHLEAPLAWRGMKLADLSDDLRSTYSLPGSAVGIVVVQVDPAGPADKAGIKAGCLIQHVDGREVRELRGLREMLPRLTGPARIRSSDAHAEITLP